MSLEIERFKVLNDLPNGVKLIFGGVLAAGFAYFLVKTYKKKKRSDKVKNYPRDVVILHQFGRGLRAPSVSPFPLKLETWLRMAGIKYQNEFDRFARSPKGKVPWITFNGEVVADSQLCIEFLMKKLNKDLSDHLSPIEKSIARAFLKLNEESIRWAGVVHRFRYGKPEDVGIPSFIFKIVGGKMLKESEGQGYGRHSKEEVYEIGRSDLSALDQFLGNKKFLMGDQVCNEDASIFGMVATVIDHDRGPFNKHVLDNCPNIQRYYDNMKQLYWQDWNSCIIEKPKN